MKKVWLLILTIILIITAGGTYWYATQSNRIALPHIKQPRPTPTTKPLPLLKYTISNLKNYSYQPSQLKLTQQKNVTDQVQTYLFEYQTMDKTMTGVVNLPQSDQANNLSSNSSLNPDLDSNSDPMPAYPVIIMLRGWVPANIYQPGIGTNHAAQVFAQNGYITIAPDFFSYGGSDPEPENSWEARFIKPINVIELIKSIQNHPQITTQLQTEDNQPAAHKSQTYRLNPDQIGIWAHSNGGQIALTTLEILSRPIPTTLWAPVTVPFPYSILFFSDEYPDEGKQTRAWLAQFEQDYDVFTFSLTQHLDKLAGPIQIHHGTSDEAALIAWSDEFMDKIDVENERRQQDQLKTATRSGEAEQSSAEADQSSAEAGQSQISKAISDPIINQNILESPIKINYYRYPGADHNLQPASNWNQAIQRDLIFFSTNFEKI